jgi:hypothetical protein
VPETPAKSRYDLTGAKSAVYRITPDGGKRCFMDSATVTAFSVHANQNGNGVFLGTSDKGRIYGIGNDGRETLVLQSNESQISTLTAVGQTFTRHRASGKLYRFGAETIADGSYDRGFRCQSRRRLGQIWWRSGGNVQLQTRSGNTEKTNETWSDWSAALTNAKGAQITSREPNTCNGGRFCAFGQRR